MNDEKIWLETEDGQKFFIIRSEKIDMQEELNKTIENLYQELQRKDNEIKQLREDVKNHIKIASEYKEQMIIKDDNWNELKKYINKMKRNF